MSENTKERDFIDLDNKLGELLDDIYDLYAADPRDTARGFTAIDEILKRVAVGWGDNCVELLIRKHGLRGHGYD